MHASRPGAKPSATLQTDRHAYNALGRENCRLVCKLGTTRPVRSVARSRTYIHIHTYVHTRCVSVDLLERGISRLALCRGRRVRSSRPAYMGQRTRRVFCTRSNKTLSDICIRNGSESRCTKPLCVSAPRWKAIFERGSRRASTREIRRERARRAGLLTSARVTRRQKHDLWKLPRRSCRAIWVNFIRNEGEKMAFRGEELVSEVSCSCSKKY